MIELSEGALDAIMAGETVENPILQILGHKKLSSSNSGERYRLLLSDGRRINSFTMLATQLNHMIDTEITEFTVCQIKHYAMSNVNNTGKPKYVMVILSLEVKVPGVEVGGKIGNPTNPDTASESEQPANKQQQPVPTKPAVIGERRRLDETIAGPSFLSTPIAALSPYQNRWVIKARVSNKSAIRFWSNSRSEGKLFSMDLVDESGEIRCTAFKEQCDKFYNLIEIGKVYYISRCTLKPANKQFSSLKNEYEMTMNSDTEVSPCHDEVDDIPLITYNFCPLGDIETKEKNDILDVIAIVKSYDDVQTLVAKSTGRELRKRDIQLIDMSSVQVTLTLWGAQAEEFNAENNPVIAAKGVRIGEFNGGKNLSTVSSTMIQLDPDIPEAHRLRGWYNSTGKDQDYKLISKSIGGGSMNGPFMTVYEGTQKSLEREDGVENYIVKGCVSLTRKDNAIYKSCPADGCNKKVVDLANDMYRCEKCSREYPNFKYRLLTNMSVTDWTGNQWATAFSEESEKFLGLTAEKVGVIKESDNDEYDAVFSKPLFEHFLFKIRTKKEVYNDELRVKAIIGGIGPVDRKAYNDHLLQEIKKLANVQIDAD